MALVTFFVIGTVFALILWCFPNWLADNYLENPDAAPSIRAMAPSILLMCLVSAYRGYCQGNGNMLPTTVDEVLEVLFKVISGLILASVIMHMGLGKPAASAGAIFGVSIGSVVSLLYMVVYKRKNYSILAAPYTGGRAYNDIPEDDDEVDPALTIVRRIMTIGIPIALGACIMSLLNSMDSKLCMNRLQSAAGFSYYEAKVLYGVYGKAMTLFNLPAAFITPLTISIVPAISGAFARGHRAEAMKTAEDSMRISAAIALPMGVGLAVMSKPIMDLLYPNSNAAGPGLLSIMGIASFFVCLVLMENAVLQASGKERLTMLTLISGGVIKIVVNWFLVAHPGINIYGAPVGTLVSYFLMAAMDFVFLCVTLRQTPRMLRIFAGPVGASLLMGLSAWAVYGLAGRFLNTGSYLGLAAAAGLAILVAVVVYLVSVIAMRVITKEDMSLIPGGDKVAKILHMR